MSTALFRTATSSPFVLFRIATSSHVSSILLVCYVILLQQLMMMLMHIEHVCISAGRNPEDEAIHWTKSGDAFVVRDEKRLSAVWLRIFFGNTIYSSFTRKLYRWSFHKISPAVYQFDRGEVTIFGSINFHRDKKHLSLQMESQTAAKQRRSLVSQQRKLKYQQIMKNKVAKTPDTAVAQKVCQNVPASAPVLLNKRSQELAMNRTNVPSPLVHRPTLGDPRADMMDRLQKGLVLANLLREGGGECHRSISAFQCLMEQAAAQNTLGIRLHSSPATMQNQPILAMHLLLEERIQDQKAQYERMQMQALAAIIRSRFAQE